MAKDGNSIKNSNFKNWGLVLRWALALNEIKVYHSIPEKTRDMILMRWVERVKDLIDKNFKEDRVLECVPDERDEETRGGRIFRRPSRQSSDSGESAQNESTSNFQAEIKAGMFSVNTIVSLICRVPNVNSPSTNSYRRLNITELRRLHQLMGKDLSEFEVALRGHGGHVKDLMMRNKDGKTMCDDTGELGAS